MIPKNIKKEIKESNEMFYIDGGKKKDSSIHNEMLNNNEANLFSKLQSFHRMAKKYPNKINQIMKYLDITIDDLGSPE